MLIGILLGQNETTYHYTNRRALASGKLGWSQGKEKGADRSAPFKISILSLR
jgi:hypothetical protein